ncbi:SusC/RagA family TonB-linked outer membrane protein [Gabonibacter chumensis]|uniref:SusC/RagA family TonB-linked outer membrane protein n=1 Tax=Gabonibacter chumensis TaxID=2972474 RepID=UPI0025733C48|nr:SusC/RagA family TonB-linked outer membrane protein [Gabonibacter chumensis]MCR9013148.1 SusC/RagA family TonB-linked outer membrane protein [Gabonibacter chumensis]
MEKKRIYFFDPHQRLKKMLTLFRTTLLLLLASAFSLQASSFAQAGRVTLKMQNATIDELIQNVRTKTEYKFLYRVEEVKKYGKQDVDIKDATIEEFLQKILANTPLSYKIQNGVIIIRPVKEDKTKEPPRIIKGKVIDEKGLPLPGVTVTIKGTTLGVATGIDGDFKLEIPKQDSTILVFSFIGMKTVEYRLKKDRKDDPEELVITLKEDVKQVEEVIITGYANIRKESFTGSSVTVKRDELLKVSKTNVIKALQVFDPSFRIQTNNEWGSDPNALPEMYIRGRSGIGVKELDKLKADQAQGFTSKSNLKDNPNLPTFILDGFQISVQKLYDMDPSRIESITILKDAAATAMYGSRAANGVVVITTVAPKPGQINVQYAMTGEITFPDLTSYNLCNAEEKLELERLAGVYEHPDPRTQIEYDKQYNEKLMLVKKGVDTYWLSLPLQTAFNHKHSLWVEGGSENIRFGVDISYYNEDGIMKKSFRDRMDAALTIDYRTQTLQIKNQISYNITKSKESPYGNFSEYTQALPYNLYKDEDGKYLEEQKKWGAIGTVPNPMYEAGLKSFNKSQSEEIINNLSAKWNITPHWLLQGQISITKNINESRRFLDPKSKKNSTPLSSHNFISGELYTNDGNSFSWDLQASISYNQSINKHNINFALTANQRANKTESISALYTGFPNGNLNSPNYAERIDKKPTSNENTTRLIGFVGLINYSYNDIYLFDASVRFDGSSEFGDDKRWGSFWSTGVGINIHNYNFMKESVIDKLKLKATYGETGKVNFTAYQAQTTYDILTDSWYITGLGAGLKAFGNKKLKWETTKSTNLSFEIGLKQDLIYLQAEYYVKKTVDLINDVTLPSATGFTSYVDNVGEIENKGFELTLRSNLLRKNDWYLAVFANLSHNKNKIVKIAESLRTYNNMVDEYFKNEGSDNSKPFTKYVEGGSTTSIFGMRSLGIDPATGNEILVRQNGTLTDIWRSGEQVVLGNTEPDASGSFGLNVTYKNFNLYVTFLYEFGGQRYNQTLVDKVENADIYNDNVDKRVLTERWQKPGDKTKFRKLALRDPNNADHLSIPTTKPTERFVQNNNVLSLNSVTLGYDAHAEQYKWLKRAGVSMLRFEIGAEELFNWSSIKAERGLNYPFARTMNLSLNLTF